MAPPAGLNGGLPDTSQPLVQWQVEDSFDTAQACRAGREKNISDIKAMLEQAKISQSAKSAALLEMVEEDCIATHDPRLAK